jgi:hypothetical protein
MNFDDPHFKSEFWRWFDNITPAERKKFKEYSADMAELYFYNKYFSKGLCYDDIEASDKKEDRYRTKDFET